MARSAPQLYLIVRRTEIARRRKRGLAKRRGNAPLANKARKNQPTSAARRKVFIMLSFIKMEKHLFQ
mgnify:CR=1 FL=1